MTHAADKPDSSATLPHACTCGIRFRDEASLAMHVTHEARLDRERLARDDGKDRDERDPKPCCKRVTDGATYGFCLQPAGHDVPQVDKAGAVIREATPCGFARYSAPPLPTNFGPRKR